MGGEVERALGARGALDAEPLRRFETIMARTAGSVMHALFIGIIVRWFMDPKQALSAHELAGDLRIITGYMARQGRPAP